ncbi:MAG: TolC family protein [Bacteroidetes bacterium]|nr:TolC family protein [Bacteroidota bacterium]
MRKSAFLPFLLLIILFRVSAQEPAHDSWSIEDCIEYAMENNIQIKQTVLNTRYNENLLKQSRLGQIPNLNGSSNYTYSLGRALDQTTYQFTDNQQINSISLGISSSVNLFNGLKVRNTIEQNELNLLASYEDVEKIKNDISLNIAAAYLTILFNKELITVTENQLEITGQQVERTRKMVDAGKLAEGSYLEIQAQYASEELNLVNAENQLAISMLNLQQTLDLPVDTSFDVIIPQLEDPAADPIVMSALEVYRIAEQEMPQIKGAELSLQSSEKQLSIAKGGRSPQLYLSGNYNTGYSDIREQVTELTLVSPIIGNTSPDFTGTNVYGAEFNFPTYGKYPFFDQMLDNTSVGVGLGLSIPIFNGWQVNTGIANARIMLENSQLELQSRKLALYASIQKAYTDALAALKKFRATEHALVSMAESFKYTEKKFEVGLVNTVDYNTSKNQLTATQSDLLQAKYDFIFRINILNFYQGEPITL